MNKIDIVIPLGSGKHWDNNEIRICLRSIEKNFLDLRNVYIVGWKPDFLQNTIYIPCDDIFKANKDANLIRKVLLVCERPELSNPFVRMSDDQIFLKPCKTDQLSPVHAGDLNTFDWTILNRWRVRLKRTWEALQSQKKSTFHYDVHMPFVYDKEQFSQVMQNYEWGIEREGFTINTLYVNNINIERKKLENNFKATFERPFTSEEEIYQHLDGKTVGGYNDKGLNDSLKNVLLQLYPEKSKFEKN